MSLTFKDMNKIEIVGGNHKILKMITFDKVPVSTFHSAQTEALDLHNFQMVDR